MSDEVFKEAARQLIDSLPADATWDDLTYAIHVRRTIETGLADVAAGRVTSVEDVRERFGLSR